MTIGIDQLADLKEFKSACEGFGERVKAEQKSLKAATDWMGQYWKDSTFATARRLVEEVDAGLERTKKALQEHALPYVAEKLRILEIEKPV